MELLKLFGKLVLDSSEYKQGMEEAVDEADELSSSLDEASSSLDSMADSMTDSGEAASESADSQKDLGESVKESAEESGKGGTAFDKYSKILNKVKTAAAAMVAVKVAKWLWETTDAVSQVGDHIDKASQKMNMSAKTYQEWSFIAEHSGTSIDGLTMSMRTLTTQAAKQSDAFQTLGISYDDIKKMSPEELFESTVKALQNVEDTTQRTVLATELLGRGATELGPLFNSTSGDIDDMKNRIAELGGVMSDRLVKNSAAYQDAMTDLQTAVQGAKNNIADFFMEFNTGVILAAANALGKLNVAFQKLLPKTFEEELEDATRSLENLRAAYNQMVESGQDEGLAMMSAMISGYEQRVEELTEKVEANKAAAEANVDSQTEKLAELRDAYEETYISVSGSLDGWFGAFDKVSNDITVEFTDMVDALESQLTFWNNYEENLRTLADAGFGDLVSAIEGMGPAGAEYASVLADMARAGDEGIDELQGLQEQMTQVDEARSRAAETITAIEFTDNSIETLADIESVASAMAAIDGTESHVYTYHHYIETGGGGRAFAGGIDYVPFHNYAAVLHEGERVLTKEENKRYSEHNQPQQNNRQPIELTVETPVEVDGATIARKAYKFLLDLNDAHGVSLINA